MFSREFSEIFKSNSFTAASELEYSTLSTTLIQYYTHSRITTIIYLHNILIRQNFTLFFW